MPLVQVFDYTWLAERARGKTIERLENVQGDGLEIHFTDGSELHIGATQYEALVEYWVSKKD